MRNEYGEDDESWGWIILLVLAVAMLVIGGVKSGCSVKVSVGSDGKAATQPVEETR